MLEQVAAWMRDAERLVVLTGAGMSAESGVPVFRGPQGLWRTYRPEDLATPEAFRRQPELVWEWYLWRRERIAAAQPHEGYRVIARLEAARPGVTLLTQNVDGLHERAGSREPVELHGNLWRVRCVQGCGTRFRDQEAAPPRSEFRCSCGAWLRPEVVWFGEPLDPDTMDRASRAVEGADLVLVVGTSAVVYPVAALPRIAQQSGAKIVEVNVDETPLSPHADAVLRGAAGEILPELERRV
jgi:NAD-dependent deacetylase